MAGKVEEAERIHREMVTPLYEKMYRIRVFESLLVPYILDGTIKTPVHLCIGQEAVAVGVCEALGPEDLVFGTHRSHGHYLAKGGDMKALACEIFGKAEGCSKGHGGSMHINDPDVGFMGTASIVGGTIGLAVGAAMALKLRGINGLAVAFFGDGATTEGVFYESLNLARLYHLPILFVCENNGYSTHMKTGEILFKTPGEIAAGIGYECDIRNGNDITEVYRAANQRFKSIDDYKRPYFLELKTYRLCGHVGPNDRVCGEMTDIRGEAEVVAAWRNDPLRNWTDYIPIAKAGEIYNEIHEIIEYAAHKAPWPEKGAFRENVF